MDATIKKIEQIARAAEQRATEALNRSILVESKLRGEIESLKARIASLEGQLAQKERPTLGDKCNALTEILSNCYQSSEKLGWEDWTEIRKQYVPDNDPDLIGVKEFFLKGQGKDLYKAVVSKPVSSDGKTVAPTPSPSPNPTPEPGAPAPLPTAAPAAPSPKKNKLRGRVSTEPTTTLVDDPDNLAATPIGFTAPSPTPTFDSPSATDITASLGEIASAGGLMRLPSDSLGRLSNFFRSALTGMDAPTVKEMFQQVEQAGNISAADRKRIVQLLIEGAAPAALQEALLSSSPFVADCFSTLFF